MGMEWIRLWTQSWINGSGRLMTAEKRGIWADLLALAGEAKLRDGTLRYNIDKPYSKEYIASILNIPLESLEAALVVFQSDLNADNGEPRIKIWEDGTIEITNWAKYQPPVPEGKGKLKGRDLELVQRVEARRLAEKFPIEVANTESIKKMVEDEARVIAEREIKKAVGKKDGHTTSRKP